MEIKDVVKERYGQAALRVTSGGSSCCGASAASTAECDPITSNLYDAAQDRRTARGRASSLARLRQSDGAGAS